MLILHLKVLLTTLPCGTADTNVVSAWPSSSPLLLVRKLLSLPNFHLLTHLEAAGAFGGLLARGITEMSGLAGLGGWYVVHAMITRICY